MTSERHTSSPRGLSRDTRGAVMVEYIVLVAFVGLLIAATIAGGAPRTLLIYSSQRAALYQSNP